MENKTYKANMGTGMGDLKGTVVNKDGKNVGVVTEYDAETGVATISLHEEVCDVTEAHEHWASVSSRRLGPKSVLLDSMFDEPVLIKVTDDCPYASWFGGSNTPLAGLVGTVVSIHPRAQKVRASFTVNGRTRSLDVHRKHFNFLG
jgi:hypothetical protein